MSLIKIENYRLSSVKPITKIMTRYTPESASGLQDT